MFANDKTLIAQMAATILAGLLSNPSLSDGDKDLNWGALWALHEPVAVTTLVYSPIVGRCARAV